MTDKTYLKHTEGQKRSHAVIETCLDNVHERLNTLERLAGLDADTPPIKHSNDNPPVIQEPGHNSNDIYVAGDNGVGYWITNLFSRDAEPECTCPDFQHRHKGNGGQCKHIRRLREVVRIAGT